MTDTYTAAKPMAADVCLFLRGLPRQQRIDDGGYSPPVDGTRDPRRALDRRTLAMRCLFVIYPQPDIGTEAHVRWWARMDAIAEWAVQADDGRDDTRITDPAASMVLRRWTRFAREIHLVYTPHEELLPTERVENLAWDARTGESLGVMRSQRL